MGVVEGEWRVSRIVMEFLLDVENFIYCLSVFTSDSNNVTLSCECITVSWKIYCVRVGVL